MDLSFIEILRKRKQLSIKELAGLTHLSREYISKIEKNKISPVISDLEKLLKILDHKMVVKDKINVYSNEEFECVNEK